MKINVDTKNILTPLYILVEKKILCASVFFKWKEKKKKLKNVLITIVTFWRSKEGIESSYKYWRII